MARTTVREVTKIMDGLTLDDPIIDAYIKGANLMVTKILGDDTTLGSSLMTEVEKWLTAHMIASTRWRTVSEEKVGDASVKYSGVYGLGLNSTPYGQMVKVLDTTGKIAASEGKQSASIIAIESF